MKTIDAKGIKYKQLNEMIYAAIEGGYNKIFLKNISGQYYIGDGLTQNVEIEIDGVPGNDLGMFMDGPLIRINGDAQDGVGNTMAGGKIIIDGNAGDVLGYSMRGGRIYIKGDVGYRTCIHMKSYKSNFPVVVVGGTAGEFAGEYIAGGILIILNLNADRNRRHNFIGAGMHGGMIIIRGKVPENALGKEVKTAALTQEDLNHIKRFLVEYCEDLNIDYDKIMKSMFMKIVPATKRPYKDLYIDGFLH